MFITDANLYDDKVLKSVEEVRQWFDDVVTDFHQQLPTVFQVVIHPHKDGCKAECKAEWQYYMVDNKSRNRSIFWFHEYDVADHVYDVKGMDSDAHLSWGCHFTMTVTSLILEQNIISNISIGPIGSYTPIASM